MVAERLDLIVATYSSDRGTGEELTVWVWTGMAWKAGPAGPAGCLAQAANPMTIVRGNNRVLRSRSILKTSP